MIIGSAETCACAIHATCTEYWGGNSIMTSYIIMACGEHVVYICYSLHDLQLILCDNFGGTTALLLAVRPGKNEAVNRHGQRRFWSEEGPVH